MHLYDQIEEYNFTHGNHFDTASGQYNLLMPHDLGRPLTHEEMDYNFLYQKQTMNGFRIFGSGTNLRLDDNDLDKVLKFHKISLSDENYALYNAQGYVADQYIWIPVELQQAIPVYVTLTANPTTINETNNSVVTFSLATANVDDGTTIDWSIATSSDISANDFVGGLTGTATINSNTATWTVEAAADNFTEGLESFTITLAATDSAGNDTTTQSGSQLSATVAIGDTSVTPSYTSISSASSVNEGSTITFTVNTANFFQAATVGWSIDQANTTASADDFQGGVFPSGTVNMSSSGSGTFDVTIANDLVNDTENFTVLLAATDSNGISAGLSKTVNINNASFPTYTQFAAQNPSVVEGQTASFVLQGTNIPNGTEVGYTVSGSAGFTLDDTNLSSLTGMITMNSGVGTLSFQISLDSNVETGESITVDLDVADQSGNVTGLPMSDSITMVDPNPAWQIQANPSQNEPSTLTFAIRTLHVPVGTTYTYEVVPHGGNPANAADFVGGAFPSGGGTVATHNFSGYGTEATVDVEVVADNTTENTEQYKFRVLDANGAQLASKNVNINDTSQTPQGEVYWFHLGGGGYPYIQDLINGAPQYLSDNSTSTSTPVFEAIFADALANPSSYETVNSQPGLQSGDQFTFGTSVAQNLYWILIPDSLGVPDLTQNARLADTANNINDVAAAKLAMNVNGNPYTLYQVNILPATGTLTIQYNV